LLVINFSECFVYEYKRGSTCVRMQGGEDIS
jgi:hypothetical protein